MIAKASQRAMGQDLATHLLNAHDNEYLELAEMRGAVARDLHGAFAEWEVHAAAMTRCENYLYSLSVNPDPAQGPLTRAQYFDYIDRVEDKLGLEGQPRAVVFHIKDGREHCHVVWSRIDTGKGKAVHQAFDHEKLMMVTRQFARDHGLELPEGMLTRKEREDRRRVLSLYEKHQQDSTGLTKEERMAQITEAWRRSDSPRAFVRALEQLGYILATGKRPYVLVDRYGHMNALPKLIDDRSVRTKDIRAFLEKEFPPESLPSIEDAKALAATHRKAIEEFAKAQDRSDKLDALKKTQTERRGKLEQERAAMTERQRQERYQSTQRQTNERRALKAAYRAQTRHIRLERARSRPTGLAAFLGRVTGVALVIAKIHKYRDAQRYRAFLHNHDRLHHRHHHQQQEQQRRHEYQALDIDRRLRALKQIDARELKSFETARLRENRVRARGGHGQMPALTLELKPPGRKAAPEKARNRYTSPLARELAERAAQIPPGRGRINLSEEFTRAARDGEARGEGDRSGSSDGPRPPASTRPRASRPRKRDKDRDQDNER